MENESGSNGSRAPRPQAVGADRLAIECQGFRAPWSGHRLLDQEAGKGSTECQWGCLPLDFFDDGERFEIEHDGRLDSDNAVIRLGIGSGSASAGVARAPLQKSDRFVSGSASITVCR